MSVKHWHMLSLDQQILSDQSETTHNSWKNQMLKSTSDATLLSVKPKIIQTPDIIFDKWVQDTIVHLCKWG